MVLLGPVSAKSPYALTDEKGRFSLPPQPPPSLGFCLVVRATGFLMKEVDGLPAKTNKNLLIKLDPGSVVHGRLVDGDTLQPVPDAQVGFKALSGSSSQSVTFNLRSGEDGRFEATGLDPGTYQYSAWGRGMASQTERFTLPDKEDLNLGDIRLSSHPTVTGTLTRADEKDVTSQASVVLQRDLNHSEVPAQIAPEKLPGEVTKDGRFLVRGVAPGRYQLVAQDGEESSRVNPIIVGGDDVDLGTVRLDALSSLRGSLKSSTVSDFASWQVALSSQAFDPSAPTADANTDGTFDFGRVPAGTYKLEAFPPLAPQPAAAVPLSLSPGEEKDIVIPLDGLDGLRVASCGRKKCRWGQRPRQSAQ